MKRHWILVGLCLLTTLPAPTEAAEWPYAEWEHRFEITPYAAYQMTGSRSSDIRSEVSGSFDFDDGAAWGILVDVNLVAGLQAEVLYQRQDTRAHMTETGSESSQELFDLGIDYLQIGVLGGYQYGKVFTFTKITVGANHLNPQGVDAEELWRFGATLGLGAKLYAHERVGLRLEMQLPFTALTGGEAIFCNEDGDCLSPVGGTGLGQLNASLGVVFLLGG